MQPQRAAPSLTLSAITGSTRVARRAGREAASSATTAKIPQQLVPIHGVAWDENTDGFPPIRRLADGETFAL